MEQFTKIFKALADPNRVRIMKMLEQKQLCVCEITEILNLSTSTVSSHLSLLRRAGLIDYEKNGKWVDYKINRESRDLILNQIIALMPAWLNDDEIVKIDLENLKTADRNLICATY